jgi:hypothetical protein
MYYPPNTADDDMFYKECLINPSDYNITIGETANLYKVDAENVLFTNKCITQTPNDFSPYYNYSLQTKNSSMSYKTFKGGEMYRFGI